MVSRTRAALISLTVAASTTTLALPTAVSAAPECAISNAAAPRKVGQIPGWAESLAVDARGRAFVTDLSNGRVYRFDRPGASPVALTGDVGASGGVLVRPDGSLLVGTLNQGPAQHNAKLLIINPNTGAVVTYAQHLTGIDGIALAPDGAVYATTFGGTWVERVAPDRHVDLQWAKVLSPNGIAVSPDGTQVWVIQTWVAPHLYRIPVAHPDQPQVWASAAPEDALAIPDGLTLDSAGRPVIATHAAGAVWRVENRSFCALRPALLGTTQVAYGHAATGFSAGRLYRTGIDGGIYEIPAGFDPGGR